MTQKRKVGRPSMNLVPCTISLKREHWEKARKAGEGNKAKGVRLALDKLEIDRLEAKS